MLSCDSVLTHICLGANDLAASTAFYDAVLAPLGVKNMGPAGEKAVIYGKDKPALLVLLPANGEAATFANGGTIGFAAADPAAVDAFHAAGIANGGTDEGQPGPRDYLPGAYAAYLRDPVGNKICAYVFV
ncbi:Catechol 2,3-dioxygenase [Novosphingobium sp. CF614]|uniref:VOC family protein n=1 Tax=Novosphingobium sp. CF614 TaxID=1884364 RepID=UPI0008E5F26C|nr:VOC family protein [Novosphingobium sp. CF614]SFF86516.1 Catechol 2,3-dioxygenase [Novosphingobium sp. CF614]